MFFSEIQEIYIKFLSNFPEFLHPFVSIGLSVLLVYSIFQTLKKNFIFIIALVVLLPASIPILKSAVSFIIVFVKFLLGID